MVNFKQISKNSQAKKLIYVGIANVLVSSFLLYICHISNSLALAAFTYLTIFDLLSIITAILGIWVKFQVANGEYPYGFKRCEVLAIFSCAILSILGAFFIIKEGVESLFEEKEVHTSRLLLAIIIGFVFHMGVTLGVRNESFDYVIKSSSSSWLQEHMVDISESLCRYVPGLHKLLLPRVNPFVLLGFADLVVLLGVVGMLQMSGSSYLADTYASILIAFMKIGTMVPFAVYTGKILMQTTPSHLVTQLDKILREASTLDGVLEFRDEHFWTLSFGVLAGSLHVRIRRDADEQLVLAHVWNKLAGLVQILTIHIFKDDWMRRTTHQLVYNQHNSAANFQIAPPAATSFVTTPLSMTNASKMAYNIGNLTATTDTSNLNKAYHSTPQNMHQLLQQPTVSQVTGHTTSSASSVHHAHSHSPSTSTKAHSHLPKVGSDFEQDEYVLVNPL